MTGSLPCATAVVHGRISTYTYHGCRCDACREAWRQYMFEYNHRTGRSRPRAEYVAEIRARAEARDNHGTETRYELGCRCDQCRAAAAAARRARRARMSDEDRERVRALDRARKRAARR